MVIKDWFTGFSVVSAAINFKCQIKRSCFETSVTNTKVIWYAKHVWLVVGVLGVSQSGYQLQP